MLDIDEAKRAIEADRTARMEACRGEIEQVLERYGMTLDLVQAPAQMVLREAT